MRCTELSPSRCPLGTACSLPPSHPYLLRGVKGMAPSQPFLRSSTLPLGSLQLSTLPSGLPFVVYQIGYPPPHPVITELGYTNLVLPLPRKHRVGLCDEQAAHRCSLRLQRGEHLCKDPRSQAGGTQTIQARKVGSQHSCPKKPEVLGPDVIDMHV